MQIIVFGLSLKIGDESKQGSAGTTLPKLSRYGNIEALRVNPSEGDVGLERIKFEIAPFLQHESQVKCQPVVGGDPARDIGSDS